MRVFGAKPSTYYVLKQPALDYENILARSQDAGVSSGDLEVGGFKRAAEKLWKLIQADAGYAGLVNGVHIPFILSNEDATPDLGEHLEKVLLPRLQASFNRACPNSHFKAVLQSDSKLSKHVAVAADSRHKKLIDAAKRGTVVGWYFPQAFQEFDVDSQRMQMRVLPEMRNAHVCLSGGMDVCSALTGVPDLLTDESNYAPILCLSAYEHSDPRMVLLLKSYGPHLEFWCMTQMLTKTTKQVSEQWSGGLTIFTTETA